MNNCETGFLFAEPGWLFGAASAFDLGGTLIEYNFSTSEQEADQIALNEDWKAVGKDLSVSFESFKSSLKNNGR